MSVESAFRSNHPDVFAVWDAYTAEAKSVPPIWRAWRDEHAPGFDYLALNYSHQAKFVGLYPADDLPSPLWRVEHWRNRDLLIPSKRTKAGKELYASMEALPTINFPHMKMPGMPREISTISNRREGTFLVHHPSVGRYGRYIYVGWAVEAERVTEHATGAVDDEVFGRHGTPLDTAMWEPVKLSEYYRAQEAAVERDKKAAAKKKEAEG